MGRALIVVRKQLAPFDRHNRLLVIVAGKAAQGFEGIPQHHGDELDLIIAAATPKQIATPVPGHLHDSGEDLCLQRGSVGLRIRVHGVAVPNARDHHRGSVWTAVTTRLRFLA